MHSNSLVRSVLICLCLSLLLGWGCASSPSSRFYTLSPMAGPPKPDAGRPLSAGISLALGPFRIPDYLDRPGIVTRPGNGNTIEIADYDLWAGSLKEAFASTLAQNLSILLDTDKNSHLPLCRSGQNRLSNSPGDRPLGRGPRRQALPYCPLDNPGRQTGGSG